jgi:hypothetical protein
VVTSAFFPDKISEFRKTGEVKIYNGKDLYKAIDGEADLFISYNFIKMFIVKYKSARNTYEIQIAHVDNFYNAYGLFSSYTSQYGKFIKAGGRGFLEDNVLTFFRDKWFVRIQNVDAKEEKIVKSEMIKLAGFFSANIKGSLACPREINFFPKKNLVEYTVRYVPKNVMGRRYFSKGFEAEYNYGGKTGRAFIVIYKDKKEAADALLKANLKSGKAKMLVRGKYLAGVDEFDDKAAEAKLLKILIDGIGQEK